MFTGHSTTRLLHSTEHCHFFTFILLSIHGQGQYTGSIVAVDENGQELACVSLNINMGA